MRAAFATLPAVVVVVLMAGVLAGCASKYELMYRDSEDQIKRLQTQTLALTKDNQDKVTEITNLKANLNTTTDTLDLRAKKQKETDTAKRLLLAKLQEATLGSPCEVAMRTNDYVITTRFTFEPGAAALDVKARSDLRKIAKAITESFPEAAFLVAGHADNTPILNSEHKTNWELSAARAFAVMHFLVDQCSVKGEKIGYAGFGEFRPVGDNGSPEGREQNRRIEIIVTP